ncbi:MAG: peptidylprolyl isomerase [Rhodobacteraceae bacterium]|nr:peptidylprolyl isomerase [Paracoccaceae bacterium]
MANPVFAADPTADTVVATVDGKEITLGHMIAMREALPEQYLQLDDQTLFNGILDQIIQQQTLAEASEAHIRQRDTLMMDNQRRSYLAGVSLDAAADAAVTDDALQALYKTKYSEKDLGTEYHASHILVETEEEAKAIKAEIEGGADFAAVAKEKSTGPSGPNGGDLGWFGLGMMVKPFEDAVVAMVPGQISDPVQTQFGWHIIDLIETRSAKAPAFEEAREELAGELRQSAVEQLVKDLTAAADVVKSVDGIDPAILKDATLIDK